MDKKCHMLSIVTYSDRDLRYTDNRRDTVQYIPFNQDCLPILYLWMIVPYIESGTLSGPNLSSHLWMSLMWFLQSSSGITFGTTTTPFFISSAATGEVGSSFLNVKACQWHMLQIHYSWVSIPFEDHTIIIRLSVWVSPNGSRSSPCKLDPETLRFILFEMSHERRFMPIMLREGESCGLDILVRTSQTPQGYVYWMVYIMHCHIDQYIYIS